MKSEPVTCRVCKQVIHWEQLGGMRLMRTRQKRSGEYLVVFVTRCGCGEVLRDDKARRVRR